MGREKAAGRMRGQTAIEGSQRSAAAVGHRQQQCRGLRHQIRRKARTGPRQSRRQGRQTAGEEQQLHHQQGFPHGEQTLYRHRYQCQRQGGGVQQSLLPEGRAVGGQQGRGCRQQRRGCQAQHPLAQGAVQQVHRLDQQLGEGRRQGPEGGAAVELRITEGRLGGKEQHGSGGMAQPRLKIQKQQRSAGNTQQGKQARQARPCGGGRRQTEGGVQSSQPGSGEDAAERRLPQQRQDAAEPSAGQREVKLHGQALLFPLL